MSFSDYLTNENHRQHINLSSYAWYIVYHDINAFQSAQKEYTLSGFINHIFINFYNQSCANLSSAYSAKFNEYSRLIHRQSKLDLSESEKQHLIETLCDSYIKEQADRLISFPKGEGKKIRLTNEVYQIISGYTDSSAESHYFKKPGIFLKAIIEEYSRLTYIDREFIFYRNIIDELNNAISQKCTISIKLINGKQFIVIPYKILPDKASSYNYFLGLARFSHRDPKVKNEYNIASFRVSRIVSAVCNYEDKQSIDIETRKGFEKAITEKGIQFLLNDIDEILIRLTSEGIKKYNSMLYLRPEYTKIIDNDIYVFHSTPMQIEFYFFKFGKDAEILFPAELRSRFAYHHAEATEIYR
ncbi:MAG: WYL domain-containing protein [Firmicutes bacterium]|nr:WYL domain-containing protein [Bacillota bacterium]